MSRADHRNAIKLLLKTKKISASLPPAVKSLRPTREEFDGFNIALDRYLSRIDEKETEENHKTHLIDVLKAVFPAETVIEQHERVDCVIRRGGKGTPPAVLIEAKTQRNLREMISETDVNRKALHEAVLYYMRERHSGNVSIANVIICSTFEFYIFDAKQFERNFFNDRNFRSSFSDWLEGRTSDSTTDFFYEQLVRPHVDARDTVLEATYFDIRQKGERNRLSLYKALSPHNLTREHVANDSNTLNKGFYDELLYIVGLEEIKDGAKKKIQRRGPRRRSPGSLIELVLAELEHSDALNDAEMILTYGSNRDELAYTISLELCLTWVNRLLFLKLLEGQLLSFHGGSKEYEFLNEDIVHDFAELSNLFFLVLALKQSERPEKVHRYNRVPYLNSSLFERTKLERILDISALGNRVEIRPSPKTVLRSDTGRKVSKPLNTLSYLHKFLAAYDFGSVPGGEIRESQKSLISASVLGLIFEKINGYKDGAVFTPGLITMNMSRRVIEAAAIDAFKTAHREWNISSVEDISNHITDRSTESILRLNQVIDNLRICDPAVGSGHYLVSCLNELIALKSRLGILADHRGVRITEYDVVVDNDELVVVKTDSDETFAYRVLSSGIPPRLQHVQKTLFEEKRKLIERCLFGVDINRNSVQICQLRLWIELLKNAFYREDGTLETLPNIDINIKVGDSLLSRYPLDQSLSSAFKSAGLTVREYRDLVDGYKNTRDKTAKRQLEDRLASVKKGFHNAALTKLTQKLEAEIATLRAREAQLGLFENGEAGDGAHSRELDAARESIAKLEQRREKELRLKTFARALEWRFEFPEVLSSDGRFEGFDIIIGNPPYGVPVTGERRDLITKIVGKVPDFEIYYMFLNQGRRLLKDGGHISFIVPNMVLSNVYARNFRLNLLDEWSDLEIDDLTDHRVFADAVVHNVIVTAKKGLGRDGLLFRRTGKTANIAEYLAQPQQLANADELTQANRNWGLLFRLEPDVVQAVSAIQKGTVPLSTLFREISQGLIAYDRYQGQDEATIEGRIFHKQTETDTTSHWINGEDVRRFEMQWNGRDFIEYGPDLANPRKPKFFQDPRVLVREITNPRIFAAYTDEEAYNDPAIINILAARDDRLPLKTLEGILNSKLATFYHFNASPKATKGAFPKILVADIREFPIPDLGGKDDVVAEIAELADDLRVVIQSNSADEELEQRLDDAVYRLYELEPHSITTIEKQFAAATTASL